jgi:hypothetical protein
MMLPLVRLLLVIQLLKSCLDNVSMLVPATSHPISLNRLNIVFQLIGDLRFDTLIFSGTLIINR